MREESALHCEGNSGRCGCGPFEDNHIRAIDFKELASLTAQRDITERKQRDDALRYNEAENRKLAMVAKTTENAVIIADPKGRVEWVNDAFTRLTGYSLEEMQGRSPGSILRGPDTDVETATLMNERVRNGEGFDVEVLNYTKAKQPYWVAIDCRPVHDVAGDLVGFIAIEVDVTARRNDEDTTKRLHDDLSKAYDATIEGWARALDLRDHETEGHSRRVTEMTVRLARAMGVDESKIVHFRRGALLHDIGKMGIPDAILRKPGPLTAEEWEVMRRHPSLAKEMLSSIDFLQPALDIPFGIMNDGTAPVIRWAYAAIRSRSPRGSSPSSTSGMPSAATDRTEAHGLNRRFSPT